MAIDTEAALDRAYEAASAVHRKLLELGDFLGGLEANFKESHERLRSSDAYREEFGDSGRPIEEIDPTQAMEVRTFFSKLSKLRAEVSDAEQYFSDPVTRSLDALAQDVAAAGNDVSSIDVDWYDCIVAPIQYYETMSDLADRLDKYRSRIWRENDHFIVSTDDTTACSTYTACWLVDRPMRGALSEYVRIVHEFTAR